MYVCWGELIWELSLSVLSTQYCCESKTTQKYKVYIFFRKKIGPERIILGHMSLSGPRSVVWGTDQAQVHVHL